MHSDKKQAQSAAQSIMASYEMAAHSDGWHEDMESVSWGMIVPVEQAQVVERKTAEPDDEFGEWVKYELRPVRFSHQPAPPAEGEVAGLVADLRMMASQAARACQFTDAESLSRAADLLERQATACAICERERLHQSTRAADLEVERQAAPVPVAAAGLCELADDLREQASQGYCEFISREDLRRVADVLEQLAVSAHKQEPAVGPPSDDELLELAQHHSVSYTMSDGSVVYPLQHGCDMRDDVLSFARAVLARYGHQPAPPAEREVGELVRWLRSRAGIPASPDFPAVAAMLTRAADLLERRHPALVPAATETRYEFCVYDENYIDQAGGTAPTYAQALSEGRHYLAQYQQDGPHTLELRRIERLPLPS